MKTRRNCLSSVGLSALSAACVGLGATANAAPSALKEQPQIAAAASPTQSAPAAVEEVFTPPRGTWAVGAAIGTILASLAGFFGAHRLLQFFSRDRHPSKAQPTPRRGGWKNTTWHESTTGLDGDHRREKSGVAIAAIIMLSVGIGMMAGWKIGALSGAAVLSGLIGKRLYGKSFFHPKLDAA